MEKWIMLEIAVCVDSDIEDTDEIVDSLDIQINGENGVSVKEYNVDNSYDFEV